MSSPKVISLRRSVVGRNPSARRFGERGRLDHLAAPRPTQSALRSRNPATSRPSWPANCRARCSRSMRYCWRSRRRPRISISTRPPGFRAAFNRRAFRDTLIEYLGRLPQAFNIAIADARGQVIVSTAAWPTPKINVADRDYFQDAHARTDGQLSTSIPINNRIDGKRTIVFARRLETAAGGFVGHHLCQREHQLFRGHLRLRSSRLTACGSPCSSGMGRSWSAIPDPQDLAGQKRDAESMWFEAVAAERRRLPLGRTQDRQRQLRRGPQDPRISARRRNLGHRKHRAWRGGASNPRIIGFGSAAFLLCSIYLLLAVTRQVRWLSNSQASLAQKSQQLDAALNNMSQGLCMFDGQQRLMVCNRQYCRNLSTSAGTDGARHDRSKAC